MSLVLLPFPHLVASARCLDNVELRRQVVLSETYFHRLRPTRTGRLAASELIWAGYSHFLLDYVNALKSECLDRGFKVSEIHSVESLFGPRMRAYVAPPPWFGDERVHISHQAILVKQNEKFYERYNWGKLEKFPILEPTSFVYKQAYWSAKKTQTKAFDFGQFICLD